MPLTLISCTPLRTITPTGPNQAGANGGPNKTGENWLGNKGADSLQGENGSPIGAPWALLAVAAAYGTSRLVRHKKE